jgi:hypothetical protein
MLGLYTTMTEVSKARGLLGPHHQDTFSPFTSVPLPSFFKLLAKLALPSRRPLKSIPPHPKIHDSLPRLPLRIHHKRSVLDNGLVERLASDQDEARVLGRVGRAGDTDSVLACFRGKDDGVVLGVCDGLGTDLHVAGDDYESAGGMG